MTTRKIAGPATCAGCGHPQHFHRHDEDMGNYCYAWNCPCKKFSLQSAKEPKP